MIHGMDHDLITFTELARRVGLSQQRISQLAATDPQFPDTFAFGPARVVSWEEAEAYFKARRERYGPKVEE
jgi:hypothetical protein